MITFDPSQLSLTPCRLVTVSYGKSSAITVEIGTKEVTLPVTHAVARKFKSRHSQSRYPIRVAAVLVKYSDAIIDVVRHGDIFVTDPMSPQAAGWLAHQRAAFTHMVTSLTQFTGALFDGETIIGAQGKTPNIQIDDITLGLRKALPLSHVYFSTLRSYDAVTDTFSHSPALEVEYPTLELGGVVVTVPKSGFSDAIRMGDSAHLRRLIVDGSVTLAYLDSYVSTVCHTFGFQHIDIFDVLNIIETLGTPNLRPIDPMVKHNFYTSTKAIEVIKRLMLLMTSATAHADVALLRRQINALLQRGSKVVAQNREFLELVASVLKSGKKVEDVHMIEYESQYALSMVTGMFS